MEKVEVTILQPKAEAMLDDMADKKLIRVRKSPRRKSSKSKKIAFVKRLSFYLSGPVMSRDEYENMIKNREWMNQWRKN